MRQLFLLFCPFFILLLPLPAWAVDALQTNFVTPIKRVEKKKADCQISERPTTAMAHVQPQYATHFAVTYHPGYKQVTVYQPWPGASQNRTYWLACRPEDFPPTATTKILLNPQRIVPLSSTYYGFLAALDLIENIVGITNANNVPLASMKTRLTQGYIFPISAHSSIDIERLLKPQPELVFTFGMGDDFDQHPILEQLAVPVVLTAEFMENHPLGRAEWLKFFAVFFNLEAAANAQFSQLAKAYTTNQAFATKHHNKQIVLAGSAMGSTWYVPGGKSYVAKLIADAGGDYIWANDTHASSIAIDFETVFAYASKAQAWFTSLPSSMVIDHLAQEQRLKKLPLVKNMQIYTPDLRNDYWEIGIVNPHILLADMIRLLQPGFDRKQNIFYRQVQQP